MNYLILLWKEGEVRLKNLAYFHLAKVGRCNNRLLTCCFVSFIEIIQMAIPNDCYLQNFKIWH
jgi:hypothetical protein